MEFTLNEEQLLIQKTMQDFARKEIKPLIKELDKVPEGDVNWGLIGKASDIGLFSGFLPRKYGGGLSGIKACIASEELAAVDAGAAVLLTASGLGMAPVAISGDEAIMDKYFPEVAEAEKTGKPIFWAFAITEPDAGSDVEDKKGSRTARLSTVAKREGGYYIINGRKQFTSVGNIAKYITVFATVDKTAGVDAWTCFIVPNDTSGFSVERIENKMGQRACPTCALTFDDVRIPVQNRVGAEGQGWDLNLQSLAITRPAVGASGVGCARGAYEIAVKYASERYQGGKQIIEHQMAQSMLVDMATRIEAARLLCYKAASLRPASMKLSSMAKVFGSDTAVKVCNDAVQILGGYGYMQEYGVEKYLRDARVMQIYEGTNQINQIAIMEGIMDEIGYQY